MNIDKAIIWLNNFKVCLNNEVYCDDDKKLTLEELREVIDLLERGEKFEKIWKRLGSEITRFQIEREHDPNYVINEKPDIINISELMISLKKKYFPEPCSKIKQLEQFKAEFIKSEHSYYMERFMETCIKLFKEKEIN